MQVSPQQVLDEIASLGGSPAQQQAGACLVDGIESDGDPLELAGGIGPAQGLFQFEPQTWVGNGGGAYGPIAGDATWQEQCQVFINCSAGDNFGAWGPDFGYSYGQKSWPPAAGSPVANKIIQLFGSAGGLTVQSGSVMGIKPMLPVVEPSLAGLQNVPVPAFGVGLDTSDFLVNAQKISVDVSNAIQDVIVERTISTASTVTMQISDPTRVLLKSGIFSNWGAQLTVDSLNFSLVETTKTGDTIQAVFETTGIADLRREVGVQATTTTNDITSFIGGLVSAVPWLGFVGYEGAAYSDAESTQAVSIGRGTTDDPFEDSWTCINRIATSAGWRCFESNNVVYLGPDSFFLTAPSAGVLQEFTAGIQDIDFDYDIGKPFGTVTATGMLGMWTYNPGQVVTFEGMGPLDGNPWLVQSMQRDLYNPQATLVLYWPVTPQWAIASPSYAPF